MKINDYELDVFGLVSPNKCSHCMKKLGSKKVVFLSNPYMTMEKENELCIECYETLIDILKESKEDWCYDPEKEKKKIAKDLGIDPYLIINAGENKE